MNVSQEELMIQTFLCFLKSNALHYNSNQLGYSLSRCIEVKYLRESIL